MDLKLRDKVAIVTGGSSGIGEATVKAFLKEGVKVVIADIDRDNAERIIREVNGSCEFFETDISKEENVIKMVNFTLERFGRIDILINNAGIYEKGDVLTISESQFDRVISVNVKGVLFCIKHVAKEMAKQGKGIIINVASEAGIVGIRNQIIYNLSKAAVISITKSCAIDLAPYGIRVNCVSPGTTLTPLLEKALKTESDPQAIIKAVESSRPLKRLGKPEEIASAIVFLSSEVCEYTTGANLGIDGGYTIW